MPHRVARQRTNRRDGTIVLVLVGCTACGRISFDPVDATDADVASDADADADVASCVLGPWSAPTPISELNSSDHDWEPALSADPLTLYLNRLVGAANDIYVAARPTPGAPFSPPVPVVELNMGTASGNTTLRDDGLEIFFNGPLGFTVATRSSVTSSWGSVMAAALPAGISIVSGPYLAADRLTLYFNAIVAGAGEDLFFARRSNTTANFGPAIPLPELDSGADDGYPTVSSDQLEIYFESDRSGTLHVYRAERAQPTDPFGPPELVTELNSTAVDADAELSRDGRTIVFASTRPGGVGGWDLYVATRDCQ